MTKADLVKSIGDTLTKLDLQLSSGDPEIGSAPWHQVYAMRIHLDNQQRLLVKKSFDEDDVAFKSYTGLIQAATVELNREIAAEKRVDKIITIVSQISAAADKLISLA